MNTDHRTWNRFRRQFPIAFGVLTLAVLLLQGAASHAQSSSAQNPDPKAGAAAFTRVGCYTCHGTVGQGGVGPHLAPNPLPIAALSGFVRNGTPGWSLLGGMPAFPPSVLSDQDLANVRAYLATIPAPPPVKDIPLLN